MEKKNHQVALVVDDEIDNLYVISQILEMHDIEVHTARSGDYALAKLKSVTPDFILLDLAMPRISGWQLLDTIRATPHLAHIPVIAITAHAMLNDRDKIMAYGFDGYIPKPFSLRHFVENVYAWINEKRRAA